MKELKKRQIVPQGERILVQRSKTLEMTAGGIILSDNAQEPPKEGVILSVGTATTHYKKNDKIMFASYAGISVDPNDEDLLIMNYKDVLALCK